MPGTVYQPLVATDRGAAPSAVTPAATFEVANNGMMTLRVVGAAGAANLTIANKTTIDGQAGPNLVVSVGGSAEKIIGPFPRGVYNNANGNIECALDTPGNVTTIQAQTMAGGV